MQTEVSQELVIPFELSIYHFHCRPISDFSLFKSLKNCFLSFTIYLNFIFLSDEIVFFLYFFAYSQSSQIKLLYSLKLRPFPNVKIIDMFYN
jgi:hypothetical protein